MATEYVKDCDHVNRVMSQFDRYHKHPTHKLRAGSYTDDGQMSCGVAEVLLGGVYTREAFADSFVRCFQRDPRDGYARHFQAFLERTKTGAEFLANIRPDSDKNGAAMRSVPLGVLKTPEEVLHVAEIQAKLTHDTWGGITSSQIVGLASHYALYEDRPLSKLRPWLEEKMQVSLTPWGAGPVVGPNVGMNTALAVVTLVSEEESIVAAMRRTIAWGGDTDSVAAIACGILSARVGPPPEWLEHGLEPGQPYGVPFLRDLGTKLMAHFAG